VLIRLEVCDNLLGNSRPPVGVIVLDDRRYTCSQLYPASNPHTHTHKPVGFYGPIAPPVPNAPVRNAPKLRSLHAAASIRISRQASCCCSSAIAGMAIGANFKIYLLRQFCSNRVEFFYNTHDTQAQKNDGPEF